MPGSLCIHGHFYQPPRENPWLEAVPHQPSAAPFHDWNARIHAECYRPNAAARRLNRRGEIQGILNNYSWMSFDFGPTLLRWLERHAPDTLAAIVQADREAVARWGVGVAMAQAYNHAILPLCSPRDLRTQIAWGLHDFTARFGRPAQGMWLPECAVDTATLQGLADAGVRYTVLAPQQIEQVRDPSGRWHPTPDGPDPRRPYRIELPSGDAIAVFVYDGPVSQAVAFERLLDNGDALYERLIHSAPDEGQLAHIATDGESYGHHHPQGEMALAQALDRARRDGRILPYGPFLHAHPPTWSARLREPSSWSCVHGVERWRADCGCHSGGPSGWTQAWRAPLRSALDALRDTIDAQWEPEAARVFRDPWAARDTWIAVINAPDHLDGWLAQHAHAHGRSVRARELMELQRHRMLMYTSCGWFFDDLAGLEPLQDLAYAWRAIELAERIWPGSDLRRDFLQAISQAQSNEPEHGTGASLIHRRVEPERFDAVRAGAHYALVSAIVPGTSWRAFSFEDLEVASHRETALATTVRRLRCTEQTTGRATTILTVARHDGPRIWSAARPSRDETLQAVLDAVTSGGASAAGWTHHVDGVRSLRGADRRRIAAHRAGQIDDLLDRVAQIRASGAPNTESPAHDPLIARLIARQDRARALRSTAALPDAWHAPADERDVLLFAAQEGLSLLIATLDADHPDTALALAHRIERCAHAGLQLDLWSAQNIAFRLLNHANTHTPDWSEARRALAAALQLETPPIIATRAGAR